MGLVAGEGSPTGRWHLLQVVRIGDERGCVGKGRSLVRKTQVRRRLCVSQFSIALMKCPRKLTYTEKFLWHTFLVIWWLG